MKKYNSEEWTEVGDKRARMVYPKQDHKIDDAVAQLLKDRRLAPLVGPPILPNSQYLISVMPNEYEVFSDMLNSDWRTVLAYTDADFPFSDTAFVSFLLKTFNNLAFTKGTIFGQKLASLREQKGFIDDNQFNRDAPAGFNSVKGHKRFIGFQTSEYTDHKRFNSELDPNKAPANERIVLIYAHNLMITGNSAQAFHRTIHKYGTYRNCKWTLRDGKHTRSQLMTLLKVLTSHGVTDQDMEFMRKIDNDFYAKYGTCSRHNVDIQQPIRDAMVYVKKIRDIDVKFRRGKPSQEASTLLAKYVEQLQKIPIVADYLEWDKYFNNLIKVLYHRIGKRYNSRVIKPFTIIENITYLTNPTGYELVHNPQRPAFRVACKIWDEVQLLINKDDPYSRESEEFLSLHGRVVSAINYYTDEFTRSVRPSALLNNEEQMIAVGVQTVVTKIHKNVVTLKTLPQSCFSVKAGEDDFDNWYECFRLPEEWDEECVQAAEDRAATNINEAKTSFCDGISGFVDSLLNDVLARTATAASAKVKDAFLSTFGDFSNFVSRVVSFVDSFFSAFTDQVDAFVRRLGIYNRSQKFLSPDDYKYMLILYLAFCFFKTKIIRIAIITAGCFKIPILRKTITLMYTDYNPFNGRLYEAAQDDIEEEEVTQCGIGSTLTSAIGTFVSMVSSDPVMWLTRLVTSIVFVVMGGHAIGGVRKDVAGISMEFFKNIAYVGNGIVGIERIFTKIPEFMSTVYNYVRSKMGFAPEPTPEEEQERSTEDALKKFYAHATKFIASIHVLDTDEGAAYLKTSLDLQQRVLDLQRTAFWLQTVMASELSKQLNPGVTNSVREALKRYRVLRNVIHRCHEFGGFRYTPFHIQFVGQPGIGKSSIVSNITRQLQGRYWPEEPESTLVWAKGSSDYYDGYANQKVVVIDDMWKVADPKEVTEILTMVSNVAFPVPMAHLEDKGTCFDSEVIISTTNTAYPMVKDVLCSSAVHRRRHLLVEVIIDKDVYDENSRKFDMSKYQAKYNDASCTRLKLELPHLTFNIKVPVKEKGGADEYVVGQVLPSGLTVPLTGLTYTQLLTQMFNRKDALRKEEESLVTTKPTLAAEKVRRDLAYIDMLADKFEEVRQSKMYANFDIGEYVVVEPITLPSCVSPEVVEAAAEILVGATQATVLDAAVASNTEKIDLVSPFSLSVDMENDNSEEYNLWSIAKDLEADPDYDLTETVEFAIPEVHVTKANKKRNLPKYKTTIRYFMRQGDDGLVSAWMENTTEEVKPKAGDDNVEDEPDEQEPDPLLYEAERRRRILEARGRPVLHEAQPRTLDNAFAYVSKRPQFSDERYYRIVPNMEYSYRYFETDPIEQLPVYTCRSRPLSWQFMPNCAVRVNYDNWEPYRGTISRLNWAFLNQLVEHREMEGSNEVIHYYLDAREDLEMMNAHKRHHGDFFLCEGMQLPMKFWPCMFADFRENVDTFFELPEHIRHELIEAAKSTVSVIRSAIKSHLSAAEKAKGIIHPLFDSIQRNFRWFINKLVMFIPIILALAWLGIVFLWIKTLISLLTPTITPTSRTYFQQPKHAKTKPSMLYMSRVSSDDVDVAVRAEIEKKILRNGIFATYYDEDGNVLATGNGLRADGHFVITSRHIISPVVQHAFLNAEGEIDESKKNNRVRMSYVTHEGGPYKVNSVWLNLENFASTYESDITVIYSRHIPSARNISHLFWKDEDQGYLDSSRGVTRIGIMPHTRVSRTYPGNITITASHRDYGDSEIADLPFVNLLSSLHTDQSAIAGESGSTCLVYNKYTNRHIYGLLTAGNNSRIPTHCQSVYTPITQELFTHLANALQERCGRKNFIMEGPLDAEDRPGPYDEELRAVGLTEIEGQTATIPAMGVMGDTKIEPSLLAPYFETSRTPAILNTRHPHVRGKKHPLFFSIVKIARDEIQPLDPQLLEVAVENVTEYISGFVDLSKVKVLTPTEAVTGLNEPGYQKIDTRTSPGLPYSLNKTLPGKKTWIRFSESGELEYLDPALVADVEELKDSLAKGVVPKHQMYDFPKDELRPYNKVYGDEVKTRSINVLPVSHSILFRQYNLALESQLHLAANGIFQSCVGITPESLAWTNMYQSLAAVNNKGIDIDVSNWDGHFPPDLMFAVVDVVNNLYGAAGASTPEDDIIRAGLVEYVLFGFSQFERTVYQKQRGMCSGFGGTATYNTIGHMILFYYFYLAHLKKTNQMEYASWVCYTQFIQVRFYGDDVIATFRYDSPASALDIANQYEHHGWPVTQASNKDDRTFALKPLSSCTFLKRSFKASEEYPLISLPAMDPETITDLLYWNKKGKNDVQQLYVNINEALEFAFFHGKEYYNQLRSRINEALKNSRLPPFQLDYFGMHHIIFKRVFDEPTNPSSKVVDPAWPSAEQGITEPSAQTN